MKGRDNDPNALAARRARASQLARKRWTKTPAERFWAGVHKTDACWLWTGAGGRYGSIQVNGRATQTHRMSWELAHGPIPDGLHVLHRCDVTRCVNPDHLFLGTHQENMHDMRVKGRAADTRGEHHPLATITEETVRMIRVSPIRNNAALARELRISANVVGLVRSGRTWKHVA